MLVVEDDLPVRSAVEVALTGQGYEVRAVPDGVSIDEVAHEFRPDLGVLDVRLPLGPNGYEIARKLRDSRDLPVIFLTAADSVEERLAGFEAGGDDYLVKPFAMAELLARVRALLHRSGRLRQTAVEVGPLAIDENARRVTYDGADVSLTRIEYELLAALARPPGRVLSKTQLLVAVWGYDAYDDNLVEVHMSALRRKLEAHGPRLLHTVRGVGYVLRP
ncbi:MAG TPA: response regulator transcription factor [Egibacteraceae bacterium]|nr:response regulator transcription factor [Egibacteraceae bacterium]